MQFGLNQRFHFFLLCMYFIIFFFYQLFDHMSFFIQSTYRHEFRMKRQRRSSSIQIISTLVDFLKKNCFKNENKNIFKKCPTFSTVRHLVLLLYRSVFQKLCIKQHVSAARIFKKPAMPNLLGILFCHTRDQPKSHELKFIYHINQSSAERHNIR